MRELLKKYTDTEFIEIWKNAESLNDVCRIMGRNISGGSIRIIRERALKLNLSRSHFSSVNQVGRKYSTEEILVKDSPYRNTDGLRRRLIKEGILEPVCSAPFCPVPNPSVHPFTGEAIALKLSLDHINGDNRDNRLENLRLLCMHCHAETDTWCGKGKIRLNGNGALPNPKTKSCECGAEIQFASKRCPQCETANRTGKTIFTYPEMEAIIAGVKIMGYLPYARTLGMSGNALRKYMKRNNVDVALVKKSR